MKILYGVNGEGMGHAVRSKVIIEELQKNHKVIAAAGGRAYNFLKNIVQCEKIGFLEIIYRNNSVSYIQTMAYNILKSPFILFHNIRFAISFIKFNPDVVITDLEPFTCYLANIFRKRCISIDNQHIINTEIKTKYNFIERMIVRLMTIKAEAYLVTSFFYPKIIKDKTYLFPPILRKEILDSKPSEKDFILVYQTSKSNKKLIPVLKNIRCNFKVYGFNKDKVIKNIMIKKFDEKQFLDDMINCKAIICNGGFTTIGEALHLGKPILSIPVKRQIEQVRNAIYLQKLKYGKYSKKINKKEVEEFIIDIKKYKKNLSKYKKEDNSRIFKKIEELLKR